MKFRLAAIILTVVLTIVIGISLYAQPYCRVSTFDIHDGLPSNSIAGIRQSADNILWVSTCNGLCYYDGYQFTTFRDGGDNGVLSSNRLRTIKPDDSGHVWLYSYDRVLHILDLQTERYTNLSEIIERKSGEIFLGRNLYRAGDMMWANSDGKSIGVRIRVCDPLNPDSIELYDAARYCDGSTFINKVVCDVNGNEWVLSDCGIHLYGSDVTQRGCFVDVHTIGTIAYMITVDGRLYEYVSGAKSMRVLPLSAKIGHVNIMMAYDERNLLFGTDNGIIVYNVPGRTWRRVARGNVTMVEVDSQGRIWAFSNDNGVMLTDIYNSVNEVFTSSPVGDARTRSSKPVWVEDKYGVIWVVPVGGVFGYFDEASRKIIPYVLESPKFGRKCVPDIEKYFVDSQKNMWVTSSHDLILINFGHYNVMRLPLAQNIETRSLVAMSDGTVLAGAHSGEIGCFDSEGHLSGFLTIAGDRVVMSKHTEKFSDHIYTMFQDSRSRIWIGTKGYGLYVVGSDGHFVHYMPDVDDKYAISNANVYDVDESSSGRIWIATYGGGVNYVDESDGCLRFINSSNELIGYPKRGYGDTRRITHDDKDVIYISTTDGLLTLDDSFINPSDARFYVSTMGGEMQLITDDNKLHDGLKFESMLSVMSDVDCPYLAPEGGGIQSMIEDTDGNICVVRETSIVLYDISGKRITIYGPNDLGENIEFSEAKPVLLAETGCIWLPTVGGLVSFHPNDVVKSDYRPNIVFTGVHFQGESDMHHILNSDCINVDSDKRNIAIRFTAMDFSNNYLLQYAFKFDDDKEWNYLQGANTVQFTSLRPGHHKLRVKSTNSDGVWLDNESEIDLYVKPAFSETIWAYIIYFLIVLLIIWAVLHYYFLHKKNVMLSNLREKEAEFYTDVSHKLRTPLTLIGAPVKEVLKTEKLSESSRDYLEIVERNSYKMLTLVDGMLRKGYDKGVYISNSEILETTGELSSSECKSGEGPQNEPASTINPQEDTILVVEDNDDLRMFLSKILGSQYNVLVASNGCEGLHIAENSQPDFILTDVTMPEMDGLTMVRNIKSNKLLSHIPIIVLSAKASEQDRVSGLKEGIDDYVTKPFSATYLLQRIANIIAQRHTLQQAYLGSLDSSNAKVENTACKDVADPDKEMMSRLITFINAHIEEEGLKIDELAEAVNLGRTVFYGKIKSLVGMTPSDFLRRMRMQRAESFIVNTRMNFSEIAFKVGFSDPKYFTKCFKKETGMTPSEYRQKSL